MLVKSVNAQEGIMGKGQQFLFVYDGKPENGEPVQDPDGEMAVPSKDQVISRKGKSWKVVVVNERNDGANAWPVHMVFLQPL
jgi:hypothetical protein